MKRRSTAVTDAPATPLSPSSFDRPQTLLTIPGPWCTSNWADGFGADQAPDDDLTVSGMPLDTTNDATRPRACGTLGAFVGEVRAQSGRHIPATVTPALAGEASQIEAVLGCRA